MKYLVLLAVLLIAYGIWRNGRLRDVAARQPKASAAPRPSTGNPQDMVRCPVCSVHLPRSDALAGRDGTLYCSEEHRRQAGG